MDIHYECTYHTSTYIRRFFSIHSARPVTRVSATSLSHIDADALGKMIGDIISASQPASNAQKAFVNKIYPGIDTANMTKRHAHKLIEQYKSMPSR